MPDKESLIPADWFKKAEEARYPFFKEGPAVEEVSEFLTQAKEMVKVILEETNK